MSVRKFDRKEGQLQVLKLSTDLATYTTQICHNNKIFPKSMRFTIVNKIVDTSLDIMTSINTANSIRLDENREERLKHQKEAMYLLNNLEQLIRFAYEINGNLSGDRVEYWIGLIVDTKNVLRHWISSDSKRLF